MNDKFLNNYFNASFLLSRVFIAILFCTVGAYGMKIYYDIEFLNCHDFTTKHTYWKGFLARESDGSVRCFWLEQAYPNRIRQGVPVL